MSVSRPFFFSFFKFVLESATLMKKDVREDDVCFFFSVLDMMMMMMLLEMMMRVLVRAVVL